MAVARNYYRLLLFSLFLLVGFLIYNQLFVTPTVKHQVENSSSNKTRTSTSDSSAKVIRRNSSVPDKVYQVLLHIQTYQVAPDGFVGGRVFGNREKRLPIFDHNHQRIKYQEWDIHKKVKGQNRGAERLITGSDSSAYYTNDHYKTFIKLNP